MLVLDLVQSFQDTISVCNPHKIIIEIFRALFVLSLQNLTVHLSSDARFSLAMLDLYSKVVEFTV